MVSAVVDLLSFELHDSAIVVSFAAPVSPRPAPDIQLLKACFWLGLSLPCDAFSLTGLVSSFRKSWLA